MNGKAQEMWKESFLVRQDTHLGNLKCTGYFVHYVFTSTSSEILTRLSYSKRRRVLCALFHGRVVRELTVGRRIGFYKIRGEIGCGNFSHVKLGLHALTKGKNAVLVKTQCMYFL